jgi:hypothetical protein
MCGAVTDSEDLSSYLYRYRLIHDVSLLFSLLSVLPDRSYRSRLPTQHVLTFIGLTRYLDT